VKARILLQQWRLQDVLAIRFPLKAAVQISG
jgi:hypothetical protein